MRILSDRAGQQACLFQEFNRSIKTRNGIRCLSARPAQKKKAALPPPLSRPLQDDC
jgi:hypothetical protein